MPTPNKPELVRFPPTDPQAPHMVHLTTQPMFHALQYALRAECIPSTTPSTVFNQSLLNPALPKMPVSVAAGLLQVRLLTLEQQLGELVAPLHQFYRLQSSQVETEHYAALRMATPSYRLAIAQYYDGLHYSLISRVSQSLSLLEQKHIQPLPVSNTPSTLFATPISIASTSASVYQQPPPCRNQQPSPVNPAIPCGYKKRMAPSPLHDVAVRIMTAWYDQHMEHPYPSYAACEVMANSGKITVEQVKKWFANRRRRENNTKTLTEIARRRKRGCEDISDSSVKKARHE